MPASESAQITIGGETFRDWTTIEAWDIMGDGFRHFRFSCTEATPIAKNFANMRIQPGQECVVTLAGQKFCSGYVNIRNASYDAMRHGVMIEGRGFGQDLFDTSIAKTEQEWDGQLWEKIATDLMKPYGIKLIILGRNANFDKPFEHVHINIGDSPWNLMERLARQRDITLGEDENGNIVATGDQPVGSSGELVEGKNIQRASCRIIDWENYSSYDFRGQVRGTDERSGRRSAEVRAQVENKNVKRFRPYVGISEHPEAEAKMRAGTEKTWTNRYLVEADIVVYGWLNSRGSLWRTFNQVSVEAPMLILHQPLTIKQVTFTQNDAEGTLTTITCSNMGSGTYDFSPAMGG
jgi:prophage tail gpP-like protein